MIISLILMTSLFDQAVLILREIGCGHHWGLKGSHDKHHMLQLITTGSLLLLGLKKYLPIAIALEVDTSILLYIGVFHWQMVINL